MAFEKTMSKFGIKELARTGKVCFTVVFSSFLRCKCLFSPQIALKRQRNDKELSILNFNEESNSNGTEISQNLSQFSSSTGLPPNLESFASSEVDKLFPPLFFLLFDKSFFQGDVYAVDNDPLGVWSPHRQVLDAEWGFNDEEDPVRFCVLYFS